MRIITHHFLYQKKYWNDGWAKALRNDRYCGAYINQAYLHRDIHSSVTQVFVPNGSECRRVYQELCRQKQDGFISDSDPPWIKLAWLAEQFEGTCPITSAILLWQRSKILKFCSKNPQTLEDSQEPEQATSPQPRT